MALSSDYDRPALTMAERLRAQTPRQLAKGMRIQTAFARERDEMAEIVANRPLGSETPRDEPKSIHSSSPPARVRWQAPIPKGTGPRKRFAEH